MDISGKQRHKHLQFWTALGPCILLLTCIIAFLQPLKQPSYLPVIILTGILLCWKWHRYGLIASLFFSFILLLFFYNTIPSDERFWQLGMTTATNLGLFVLVLSLEEAEAVNKILYSDQQVLQSNVLELNGKVEELSSVISESTHQLSLKEKLIDICREELDAFSQRKEQLLEELLEQKKGLICSKERLDKAQREMQIKSKALEELQQLLGEQRLLITNTQDEARLCHQQIRTITHDMEVAKEIHFSQQVGNEKTIKNLNEKNEGLSREKSALQISLQRLQSEFEALHQQQIVKNALIDEQQRTLEALKSAAVDGDSLKLCKECAVLRKSLEELVQEKEAIAKEKNHVLSLHKQLREQFDGKSSVLNQTRCELFHTRERLFALLREKEEAEKFSKDPEADLLENYLLQVSREHETANQEIFALEQLVTAVYTKPTL